MCKNIFPIPNFTSFQNKITSISIQRDKQNRVHTGLFRLFKMCSGFLLFMLIPSISVIDDYAQSPVNTPQTQEDPYAELRRRMVEPPKIIKLDSAVIKVPMVGTKTLPLIEVKINGRGPYKFLVDTGANVTILQNRLVEELKLPNLKPVGKPIIEIKEIQIGGAHFQDLRVGAREWDEKIDGVLGFNVFADCLLTIDYPKQNLILRQGTIPPANGKDVIRYSLTEGGHPSLETIMGNEKIKLMIDTGSVSGFIIPEDFAAQLSFVDGLSPGPTMKTFATPKSQAKVGRLAANVIIGIHQFIKPIIYVRNEEFPTIGSKILQDFILTFDQKNQTVRIGV